MPKQKEKLLLASASYAGSLRYFEKLVPYLGKYEVFFLFTPKAKEHFLGEMTDYCRQKGYHYKIIPRYSLNKFLIKIPFLHTIAGAFDFRKRVRRLLKDKTITRIISVFDNDFYDCCLFREANNLGIKTMLLQWSLSDIVVRRHIITGQNIIVKPKPIKPKMSVRLIYSKIVRAHQFLARLLLKYVLGFNYKHLVVKGTGNSQKFGVINQQAYDLFKGLGVKEEKMSIVGYLDFDLAKNIKEELDNNFEAKKKKAQEYGIDLNKQNIVIFSSPFDRKDLKVFSHQEQLAYSEKIIKTIREVFDPAQTDILFKVHPAEDTAPYEPLHQYGVKIYNKYAVNREVIYFADLYVAHNSTTNFIPIVMDKNAIFVNFIKLKLVKSTRDYFGIKQFISDFKEFKKLLIDLKNNQLEKQYIKKPEIFTKDSIKKIVNWID